MSKAAAPVLGLCFSGENLYYAVSLEGQKAQLSRIGQVQFQFDVAGAVKSGGEVFKTVQEAVKRIVKQSGASRVQLVAPAEWEVWTNVPKSVYDEPEERTHYLNAYGSVFPPLDMEPVWFPVSNREFRLLVIRSRSAQQHLGALVSPAVHTETYSQFECGVLFARQTGVKGSFLTIHFSANAVTAASLILGKLRGAVTFPFEHDDDLPYLWLHHARHLHWMRGIHDRALLSGRDVHRANRLRSFIDPGTVFLNMDSLDSMQLRADDLTYGFPLSEAWPAVMASLDV